MEQANATEGGWTKMEEHLIVTRMKTYVCVEGEAK